MKRISLTARVAAVTCTVAMVECLLVAYSQPPLVGLRPGFEGLLLGTLLAATTAVSYRYPIHVRHNLKMYMATVPVFLIAAATGPVAAAVFGSLGILCGEVVARGQTGAYISDLMSSAARYALIALSVSWVIHTPWIANYPVRLFCSAIFYWIAEAITLPLVVSPVNGEPPVQVVMAFVQNVGPAEAAQYGIGILGSLLLSDYPWALLLLGIPAALVYSSFKNAKEMHESTIQMLESMADAVDLRDPYTGGHSRRVAEYTRLVLLQLGKGGIEANLVVSAARVHDIGKIGLPDSVLLKDGMLTPEEQAVMQTHSDAGAQLLRRYREFARGIEVVRHHHERWDGEGYPARLKGQGIPFGARIVAVADAFDAMTSDRPYRKGMSHTVARGILEDGRGTQWDPEAVEAFLRVLNQMNGKESDHPVQGGVAVPSVAA